MKNKKVRVWPKGLSSTTTARSHRVEPNGPISLLHRQNFGAAPLRGAETGVSIPTQGGRNRGGHTKKATPENLLVGALVNRERRGSA